MCLGWNMMIGGKLPLNPNEPRRILSFAPTKTSLTYYLKVAIVNQGNKMISNPVSDHRAFLPQSIPKASNATQTGYTPK